MFSTRRRKIWATASAVIIAFYLIARFAVGSTAMLSTWPALEVLHLPVAWWQSVELWFTDREKLQQQYLTFEKQVQQQAALIQESNALREENRQLRKILEITNITGYRWHAAKVRGRSPEMMSQRLILQVDNVSSDDVIVSSEGLVGVVESTAAQYATVRTIFDASLAVPVTIPGTALAAISRGQGDSLSIEFVPKKMAPGVGQLLYTSGAGGLFPPGIIVARITEVEPISGQLFVRITAEPVAHWQRDNWLAVASQLHDTP